jgi:hypothetical protein
MIGQLRLLDTVALWQSPRIHQARIATAFLKGRQQEMDDYVALCLPFRPQYHIFNDNAHEHYSFSWSPH